MTMYMTMMDSYAFNSFFTNCSNPCQTTKIKSTFNGKIPYANSVIRLYFDQEVTRIKTTKKVDLFNVFNVIGNAGGLWLGVSIMTMFDGVKMVLKMRNNSCMDSSYLKKVFFEFGILILQVFSILFFAIFTCIFISGLYNTSLN